MAAVDEFTTVLNRFVGRSAYTPGQLASLTGLPKMTIVNWLGGRVAKPRNGAGIVALAAAMRLTRAEADTLLSAASQPSLREWQHWAKEPELRELLTFWHNAGPIPFQVPPRQSYFVGRAAELERLMDGLKASEQMRLHWLYGMAGVGKTTLVAEAAYRLRDHFADGVLWVRLDSAEPMSILATLAQSYGMQVDHIHDLARRSQAVRDLLQNKQLLLVMDNAVSSEQLEFLLLPTGRSATVVTTRRQDLAILAGAKRYAMAPFARDSGAGLALFKCIVGEELVSAAEAHFVDMADELGQLPLAIIIAASRLAYEANWEPDLLRQRLDVDFDRLKILKFDTLDVAHSFLKSYEQLTVSARRTFALTGLLGRQPFRIETVASLSGSEPGETEEILRRLAGLSLVQKATNGRYQLHPLLHDFANSLVDPVRFGPTLLQYWLNFVTLHRYAYAVLATEIGHIDAAIGVAREQRLLGLLTRILSALQPYYVARGEYVRALRHLDDALAIARTQHAAGHMVTLLLHISQLYRLVQRLDEASKHIDEAVEIGERAGLPLRTLYTEKGILLNCQRDLAAARQYLRQAKAIEPPSIPDDSLLDLYEELGILGIQAGEWEDAERDFAQGELFAAAIGHQAKMVLFLKGLGAVKHLSGQPAGALEQYRKGLQIADRIGFRKGQMLMNNNVGTLCYFTGVPEQALTHLRQALQQASDLGETKSQLLILENLGRLTRDQDALPDSLRWLTEWLALARQTGDKVSELHANKQLAVVHLRTGSTRLAQRRLDIALQLAAESAPIWTADIHYLLSLEQLYLGDILAARRHFQTLTQNAPDSWPQDFTTRVKQLGHWLESTEALPERVEHLKILI